MLQRVVAQKACHTAEGLCCADIVRFLIQILVFAVMLGRSRETGRMCECDGQQPQSFRMPILQMLIK